MNSPGPPGSAAQNTRARTSMHRYKVQLERAEREEEEQRLAAEREVYYQAGPRDAGRYEERYEEDFGSGYSTAPPSDTVVLEGLGDDRPQELVCPTSLLRRYISTRF